MLWVVLAIVSFFLFFVPPLQGAFYFALDVLVASLVLMASGALIMLAGTSGWWEGQRERSWVRGAAGWQRGDRLRTGERLGEVVGVFISFLILLFFYENQVRGTGFFTTEFKLPEQILFYGPAVFGALIGLTRAAYGRRNAIRPLEILQAAFVAGAALWLVSVFPFDFANFTVLMPSAIRPALYWVTDGVAVIVLWLAAIGSFVNLLYTSALYATVRERLPALQGPARA